MALLTDDSEGKTTVQKAAKEGYEMYQKGEAK